ncbi:uncharacterized protein K444DRAFT_646579 [Hyaloscypha bicolor E]|uniref:Fungal N-terminal domain-containing protein n=1 Tax=Hyaloscypha bicolor E TaxID=1095630 RepID=A0A2J6SSA1_9HELO|nr:uncharacterized protein K444DRAFT_646579 [Hyaloscypha bicolor E]PMD53620.1 hypothetical protein K444DRAFT_646579 [Hyaloscypha bicolor E]
MSVSNFISALELVATGIDALCESGESFAEFRSLVAQLETLQVALESVNCLEVDDAQQGGSPHCAGWEWGKVKDGWMKIRWALCKKEDLSRFKLDLVVHTESIQMLLTTLRIGATRIDDRRNHQRHQTIAGKVQESYFGCVKRMSVIVKGIQG